MFFKVKFKKNIKFSNINNNNHDMIKFFINFYKFKNKIVRSKIKRMNFIE